MKKYFKLMRVHHYIKNMLIFLPLVFGGQLMNGKLVFQTLCGFLAFCFLSSVVYIINDIRDVENDRRHSVKCMRPIASGAISVKKAAMIAGGLFIVSMALNFLSCKGHVWAWGFILLYFGLNLAYSMGLKNYPIIDITIIVSGFLLRILYGSAISGIEISNWLYLTVIALSFYMALGKRRNEMIRQDGTSRSVLQYYTQSFLDKNMYMSLALTITFYSLWSVDPLTIERIQSKNLVWTVPLVILISMRYNLTLEGNSEGDPVDVIFSDKIILLLLGIFVVCTFGIIYF